MSKKAVNFDLSVAALKEHYPNSDYLQAYKDVRRFLERNGFEHRQWSGYITTKHMSDTQIQYILDVMFKKYRWLEKCANKVDITNIGRSHDYLKLTGRRLNADRSAAKPGRSISMDMDF